MTKVQTTFPLSRPLTDPELKSISRLHAVYGILIARVLPSDQLFIEYDASRLSSAEVRGTVEQHGIPVA
ncbi:MAG: hypothetical protein JO340_10050 [Acidobacteriaceae bacterium]|nr:hypothetical protein [Acidobacteriaceae bacterium]